MSVTHGTRKYAPRVIGGAGVIRSSDEMVEIESPSVPAAAADPQSEADNRPMLAEDALSREVARDVVVHDHVQDGERMHASLQGVVMGSKLSLAIAYAGVLAFAVWILQHLFAEHAETHSFGWAVAGIFVLLAVPLSLHEIHMHAIHYVSPLQRFYIRIIWMVPIYSVESFLALRFKEQKVYLETLREAYESWVIFSYFLLLREFLDRSGASGAQHGQECKHLFPFKYLLKPWRLGAPFMRHTLHGVYQYVFVRTGLAVMVLLAQLAGVYGEGEWQNPYRLYLWQMIFVNLSQTWALYCLVLFYHELLEDLRPLAPFGKFVSIKCVIFLSFWQSVMISLLAYGGYINETHGALDYSRDDVTKGLQDFLICIEMGLAAILYRVTFSWQDFQSGGELLRSLGDYHRRMKPQHALIQMLPLDVVSDVQSRGKALLSQVVPSAAPSYDTQDQGETSAPPPSAPAAPAAAPPPPPPTPG